MLYFQQVWPRLIWSSRAPDICENLRGGQAATPAGKFNKIDKNREIYPCQGQ